MITKKALSIMSASLLVAIVCLMYPLSINAASSNQIITKQIYINDQAMTLPIIEQNGYQLVPVSLFKQLGNTVEWRDTEKSVLISKNSNKVKLPVGKNVSKYISFGDSQWQKDENLDTRTTLINGRSYVPLAYTANKLGIQVEYDTKLRAAKIVVDQDIKIASTKQLSDDEVYWLYRITEAEAGGESYEGRAAVAATVLNRTESADWPDSVVDVIFQVVHVNGNKYYQFEPVLNKYIYEVTPSAETMDAVQAAINGYDPTNGAVVFYNPTKTSNKWILSRPVVRTIGNHVFAL